MVKALAKWHASGPGLLIFGIVELVIAYGLASLSVNNGNLWFYLLTLIFLIGALRNLGKLLARAVRVLTGNKYG